MSQAMTKVCRFCQADVAGKPRIKDKKGRYACQPCFEKVKARQEQAQRIPEPKSNPYSAFAPDIDTDSIAIGSEATASRTMPCPSCRATIGAGDVFCVNCGTNVQTGGKIGTVKVKKAKARRDPAVSGDTVATVGSILIAAAIATCMVMGAQPGADRSFLFASLIVFFAYAAAVWISMLVVACKQSGVGKMLLVWFVPFYALFWVYGECASGLLKLNFTLTLLLYIPYFMALSSLGGVIP